jgi:hypothetical protein
MTARLPDGHQFRGNCSFSLQLTLSSTPSTGKLADALVLVAFQNRLNPRTQSPLAVAFAYSAPLTA